MIGGAAGDQLGVVGDWQGTGWQLKSGRCPSHTHSTQSYLRLHCSLVVPIIYRKPVTCQRIKTPNHGDFYKKMTANFLVTESHKHIE